MPQLTSGTEINPSVRVGIGIRKAWKFRDGENVIRLIPELLLEEYLEQLERLSREEKDDE